MHRWSKGNCLWKSLASDSLSYLNVTPARWAREAFLWLGHLLRHNHRKWHSAVIEWRDPLTVFQKFIRPRGSNVILGADHLTLEGAGGGRGFWKKFPARACRHVGRKKLHAAQNSCAAVRKKKNVAKLFHHSGGLYKIAAKLQPFSSLAPFELWIWWCCKNYSYVQCIISLSQAVL